MAAARAAWQQPTAPALDPHRVVFVDETGANTAMDRRYGYAPRGEPVVGTAPHGHDKSRTFAAALRAGGRTAARVQDGPMSGAGFRDYVTAVLAPAVRPGGTAVMDNLPCHKAAAARAAVEAAGCRLEFVPPDSPDLNPLELAFARLERRLRSDGHRQVPALTAFLGSAAGVFRPAECMNDIRHGGYGEPPATPPPN